MSEYPHDLAVGRRQPNDFESLLERALSPVDPPEELEAWELSAMRDPRNWARPVAAAAVGSGAAIGLVLVRTQRRRHKRRKESHGPVDLVGRTLRDLAREARRVADDVF